MKRGLLEILACPDCGGSFTTTSTAEEDGEIREGSLTCVACRGSYPIVGFIPRCLPKHRSVGDERLADVQKMTQASFGYQWTTHDRYGWDDPHYNLEKEKRVFHQKTLFVDTELKGKRVLDAGCGNGRYLHQALECGAEVVGVDLSDAVEAASRNTRRNPRAHVIQGDLLRLPFKPGIFDYQFSIGVLMHTGDARRALGSILRHLKSGGSVAFRLYGRGNPCYEFNDRFLRGFTTRFSPRRLEELTWYGAMVTRVTRAIGIYRLLRGLFYLHKDPVILHDWYSAPVASHHSRREVERWFKDLGLVEARFGESRKGLRALKNIFRPPGVTARASKPPA
jgi:SAM-dependent methyltransferase/uncharacterized protein YbaR (Trm112 family)